MPNSDTFSALVETATKCLATALTSSPSPLSNQSRALSRVGHRFQRRERLRGDDEKRFCRIQIVGRLDEISAIDVGNETKR